MKPHIEKLLRQAVELQKLNKLDAAEALYEKVRREDPKNPDALHLLGVLYMTRGDLPKAQTLIVKAIKIRSNDSAYYSNLGIVLKDQGAFSAALGSLDQALKIQHDYPEALCNRGLTLEYLRRREEAIRDFDSAIALRPGYAAAYSNKGITLQAMGKHEEALACFRSAIASDPTFIDAFNNYAALLRRLRRYPESLKIYEKTLRMSPNHVEAFQGRGELLAEMGRPTEALRDFDTALRLRPNYADALWAKGFTNLAIGNFDAGWELYDQRFEQSNKQCSVLSTPRPRWTPSSKEGTLLIWSEQGVGDELFFAQWMEAASKLSTKTIFAVDGRLKNTYRRSFPDLNFVDKTTEVSADTHDQHLPMGSIPKSLRDSGYEWSTSRRTPYLVPNKAKVAELSNALSERGKTICGLTWKSTRPGLGDDKSLPLTDLLPILKLPNFKFVNLQYGDTAEEVTRLKQDYGVDIFNVAGIDNFENLDDHVSLVAACDELVLVCNATSHIAGALGKPAHLLTPIGKALIWYWGNHRDGRSLWYPTLKMHPQSDNFSWKERISFIAGALHTREDLSN